MNFCNAGMKISMKIFHRNFFNGNLWKLGVSTKLTRSECLSQFKLREFLKFSIICGNIIFETQRKFARGDEFMPRSSDHFQNPTWPQKKFFSKQNISTRSAWSAFLYLLPCFFLVNLQTFKLFTIFMFKKTFFENFFENKIFFPGGYVLNT